MPTAIFLLSEVRHGHYQKACTPFWHALGGRCCRFERLSSLLCSLWSNPFLREGGSRPTNSDAFASTRRSIGSRSLHASMRNRTTIPDNDLLR
eukprot:scaffold312944_cov33-Tisochrysis_lutea.AAC.2